MYCVLGHLVLGYLEQPRRRWEFSSTYFVFRYRMMFHTLFTGKYFKSTNVNRSKYWKLKENIAGCCKLLLLIIITVYWELSHTPKMLWRALVFFPEKVTLIVLFAYLPYFYWVKKSTEQYWRILPRILLSFASGIFLDCPRKYYS